MTQADIARTLAAQIKEELQIDPANGTMSGGEGLYTKLLPADISEDQVKAVHNYNSNFIAASSRAVGELAHSAMIANADLAATTHTIGMHSRDSVTITAQRDGDMLVAVKQHATNGKAGELKKAFTEFGELAKSLVGEETTA